MGPGHDRRAEDGISAAILGQLTSLHKTVADNHTATLEAIGEVKSDLKVHIKDDDVVAETVAEHEERWKKVDGLKWKAPVAACVLLLLSGAAGAWGKDAAELLLKVVAP